MNDDEKPAPDLPGQPARSSRSPGPTMPEEHADLTSPDGTDSPTMPHERDEKVGTTNPVPDPMIEQAAKDLERGLQDTSRAEQTDAAYRKQKG